jgi:hypothetical protein
MIDKQKYINKGLDFFNNNFPDRRVLTPEDSDDGSIYRVAQGVVTEIKIVKPFITKSKAEKERLYIKNYQQKKIVSEKDVDLNSKKFVLTRIGLDGVILNEDSYRLMYYFAFLVDERAYFIDQNVKFFVVKDIAKHVSPDTANIFKELYD